MDGEKAVLVGDAALAAAFLTYAGAMSLDCRVRTFKMWEDSLTARDVIFSGALANSISRLPHYKDPQIREEWCLHGLPHDTYTMQGALVVSSIVASWIDTAFGCVVLFMHPSVCRESVHNEESPPPL